MIFDFRDVLSPLLPHSAQWTDKLLFTTKLSTKKLF